MKRLVIDIKCCKECFHCDIDMCGDSCYRYCNKQKRRIKCDVDIRTPSWCPLEEVKE